MKETDEVLTGFYEFKHTKLFRSMSVWFGTGLYVAGIYMNLSGNLSAINSSSLLKEFSNTEQFYADDVYLNGNFISSTEKKSAPGTADIISSYITIDTSNFVNILESAGGFSSISDKGEAQYEINFIQPLGEYIYLYLTSEPTNILRVLKKGNSMDIVFDRPLNGIFKIIFFKKLLLVKEFSIEIKEKTAL